MSVYGPNLEEQTKEWEQKVRDSLVGPAALCPVCQNPEYELKHPRQWTTVGGLLTKNCTNCGHVQQFRLRTLNDFAQVSPNNFWYRD